jgi:mono/diheme cytochrome c family protein
MRAPRITRALRVLPALALLALGRVAGAVSPQHDYVTHCMGCHGPDGRGVPGKIPPLRESLPVFARSAEGRAFLLSVPGASNSNLTDAELAAVVNWLLERFAGADGTLSGIAPFTAEEVSRLRRPPLSRVREARGALLRNLAGTGPLPAEDY